MHGQRERVVSRPPFVLRAMPQNNKMFVKLTPAGEAAVWQWVQAVRKDAASLAQSAWIAQAHKQVNLCDTSFDGLYRVWLRGADSVNGHLQALVLKASWYEVQSSRQSTTLPAEAFTF